MLGVRRSTTAFQKARRLAVVRHDPAYRYRLTSGLFGQLVLDAAWDGQEDGVFGFGGRSDFSGDVSLDGQARVDVLLREIGVERQVDGGGRRTGLAVKEVLDEGRVRSDVWRRRVPAGLQDPDINTAPSVKIVHGRDLPPDQDLSSASKLVHQIHHALVVVHIHGDLLVGFDMRQSKAVPDLDLGARTGSSVR